jgi:hypothetical protein
VILRGTVGSVAERYLIKKTIMDIDGLDNISDELVVMDEPEGTDDEEDGSEVGLLNRDCDDSITEDAYEAMEDGIPYIPPDRPMRDEISDGTDWKTKRRKRK